MNSLPYPGFPVQSFRCLCTAVRFPGVCQETIVQVLIPDLSLIHISLDTLFPLSDPQCINIINREFAVVHTAVNPAVPLSIMRYTYESIPKLYGLLDTTALESSGILPLFDQPILRATGRGVILGIIAVSYTHLGPDRNIIPL